MKRKALEGEKIIITNAQKGERDRCPFDNGDVLEVVASNPKDNYVHVKPFAKIYDEEYMVKVQPSVCGLDDYAKLTSIKRGEDDGYICD